jgi:hypothetical protein
LRELDVAAEIESAFELSAHSCWAAIFQIEEETRYVSHLFHPSIPGSFQFVLVAEAISRIQS